MTDLVERLRKNVGIELSHEAADEIERLRAEIERLRTALGALVNDSMYKDHPEASQMAIDALERKP